VEESLGKYDLLRPYQKTGVQFFLKNEHALLADEMGLGKTVQTAVSVNILFHNKKIDNALIICPTSLKLNWKKELQNWCPLLSAIIIKGNLINRKALYDLPYNIWIASYEQIRNDITYIINNKTYDLVILDEAQRIKNKSSSISSSCKLLRRKMSWVLTGTPIENNIEELFSIFSFLQYGIINNFDSLKEIKENIKPYFLRRTKKEVLEDLPPIISQEIFMELSDEQQITYDERILDSHREIDSDSSISNLFSILTNLKQICNFDKLTGQSSKYEYLINILEEAIVNNKKVLIFSQFVSSLETIRRKLKSDLNLNLDIYHGGLNELEKEKMIANFENSNDSFNLLLISLKAGGVGLNLNSATIVIMFDMWWNPAVENQAIQRAHRFGKKEPLHVIKFISSNTIEEKIKNLLIQKQELFDKIIETAESAEIKLLSKEDLITILKN
jgi:SNF2 family DNA or RNA helicase